MSLQNYTSIAGLHVENTLFNLVSSKICPTVNFNSEEFWQKSAEVINRLSAKNKNLLSERDRLQEQINRWHKENPYPYKMEDYKAMLFDIGYLVPEGEDFTIETQKIDDEIALTPGPQLVVPVDKPRFAVNATNTRWGSLFNAIYGSNLLSGKTNSKGYDPVFGQKVIQYSFDFLNKVLPLNEGGFEQITHFSIIDNQLQISLDTKNTTLKDNALLIGYTGEKESPNSLLFKHNSLHIEIQIDPEHIIGKENSAGIKDIIMESAVTVIQDCEDSVAAVDGEDKAIVYNNWFELLQGTLTAEYQRDGKDLKRVLAKNKKFKNLANKEFELSGRCLLLVRNVGHLTTTPAVLTEDGKQVQEGLLDALVTTLCALNDIYGKNTQQNSKTGNLYIVKPKMHGPKEVEFTTEIFAAVEELFGLPQYTLKMGIMDEERRTSLNLKECIRAARNRVFFINTGFLDRTGDEIHTSMEVGAFKMKAELKQAKWLNAYEDQNVNIGLASGFQKRAQIGKGMWAIPDDMSSMIEAKIDQPKSGANTAWVPSPMAATLHSLHYHLTDVWENQQQIMARKHRDIEDMLTVPINDKTLNAEEIQKELENNCQGLLGYVVRWIDQGIGCSKIKDLSGVELMEDRATLRISSQHIANWLHQNIISKQQVEQTLQKMAKIVDGQNATDPNYQNMAPSFNGYAYKAAYDLIFNGTIEPNGYTEPTLNKYRLLKKSA
jgi:malate synthase